MIYNEEKKLLDEMAGKAMQAYLTTIESRKIMVGIKGSDSSYLETVAELSYDMAHEMLIARRKKLNELLNG